MRILGIDPGLANMGWGVIEMVGPRLRHVANGIIKTKTGYLGARHLALHTGLRDVTAQHAPDAAAGEPTCVRQGGVATLQRGPAPLVDAHWAGRCDRTARPRCSSG